MKKYLFAKHLKITTILLFIVSLSLVIFWHQAMASVTPTVTSLVNYGNNLAKGGSGPAAAIKIVVAVSAGETLSSVTVAATDGGSTGFIPGTDLATLSTTATTSGVALYNDAGSTVGSFDATDVLVPLTSISAWANTPTTTTLTLASPGAAGVYYLVYRTATSSITGHSFVLTVPANGIVTSANSPSITPVSTSAITIDKVAPTIDANRTGPANNSTGVPIQAFINVSFSENIDPSTINSSNVVLTANDSPVNVVYRTMPDGFNVIPSDPPTFATSTRFAKWPNTTFGFFMFNGTSQVYPMGGTYTTPALGDIVMFQHETFPAELGVITNATLTSGTFGVNNFALMGGQQLVKLATAATTTAVNVATGLRKGDIVVANTSTYPTSDRYAWHIVTSADEVAVNHTDFRLDGSIQAPTYVSSSRLSAIAPTATATDNGATGGGVLAVSVGDLVFAKLVGGSYGWHITTGAGNLSSDSGEGTAILDNLASAAASLVVASSQMSKLTPSTQAAVTDSSIALNFNDIIFAKAVTNAAFTGTYAYHLVSGAAASISNSDLRLDNITKNLTVSTAYTLTIGTGVKDKAGNSLASPQVINFTTGSTGSTNITPPFVQSSQPQPGSQTASPNAPIKITFSVPMATEGAGSVTNSTNIGLFTENYGGIGSPITATITYDSNTNTVTVTPSSSLATSTSYVVKVLTATQSANGATLMQPYMLFFKTAGGSDTTAPTVTGISPANGATNVSRSIVINVGFSEDVNPSTIASTTLTLKKTDGLVSVAGNVGYNPSNRSATFSPSTQLESNTGYTVTVVSGSSGVKDLAGNALAADYVKTFTTSSDSDSTSPVVSYANADNYGVAITFNEQVKSGAGPNAADNISNYTLESPVGSSISLSGKTVTYDGGNRTAKISGLSLQNGNSFKITVSGIVQDLAGNFLDTTGTPAKNTAFGSVQNSNSTGGQLGPGSGSGTMNMGQQGMNPTRVSPISRAAGATSNYRVEFLASTTVPVTGQVVLTFPSGFDVTSAAAISTNTSFCNQDLNGPMTGTVTIGSVSVDAGAGEITVNTAGAATGNNAFICLELSGIVNSTIPSNAGYTVDIKTKNTAANNRSVLETKTSSPFFLGQAGSRTLTVNVFNDNGGGGGTAGNNIKDGTEAGITGVKVFLASPAVGGQEATTNGSGVASFTGLADGDYQVGIRPNSTLASYSFNPAPQQFTVSASSLTKNFGLTAAAYTIAGTVTGPASTAVDVFASSQNGFSKTTLTLTGGADAYTLPAQNNTTYQVGVGPAMPEMFSNPGSTPPPPPTFNFMPPPNLEVKIAGASATSKNFTLTETNKTITGTVLDSSGTGVSNAGIFCRPVQSSTGGTTSGFGTGGQTNTSGAFSVRVTPGVYLCGVAKPGMPPVSDKQINVPTTGSNSPTGLSFTIDASTGLTITGTIKDDAGNAIAYAGTSARKVVSTTDTTPLGGDGSNFAGGPADVNGSYTIYVTAGTWVVEAFAPGFGRLGTKTVTVTTSSLTGQDFSAETMSIGTITGTASKNSAAMQGVMVRAESTSGGNMANTDISGAYTLKVPAGTYTLRCFFPGYGESAPVTNVVVTANTTTSNKNCSIGAPITITVKLTDGTSAITNAGIDVRDSNGRGNFTNVSTVSTIYGVYAISVPPGTYTVWVNHPAFGKIGETAGVNTTREITHTVSGGALKAVTGTINGDGSALSGVWVSLVGTPTGSNFPIFLGAQSGADGTFSISVPNGSYRIRADKPGFKSPAETTIAVTEAVSAGTISLTTASRTITGTVTLDSSGVSNAFVDATDGNGGYSVAQTNSSGSFSLAVDNGTWTLRAHSKGYEGGPMPVTVSNDNPSGKTITLSAISGFVLKPEKPENITPTSGGMITNSDIGSNFQVNIPANALGTSANAATLTTTVNTAMPNPPSGSILNKNAVTISAVDASGSPIKNLNDNIIIKIPYDPANLPVGTAEGDLVLGVWNDANQTYDTLTTAVDTDNNILTATVSHLSDFAPLIPSSEGAPETPSGLTVVNTGNGSSVSLSWNSVSGATSYNIYKSTDNSSYPLLTSNTGVNYTATGLSAGTTYYFKVSAVSADAKESAASSYVSINPFIPVGGWHYTGAGNSNNNLGNNNADTTPPTNTSITISSGADTASSVNVTLTLSATGANQMMISNNPNFTGTTWEDYVTTKNWALLSGGGLRAVYVKYKDSAGNISTVVSDSINLKVDPNTITPVITAPKQDLKQEIKKATVSLLKDLKSGSMGADVTALQSFLEGKKMLIMPKGIAKGTYGAVTAQALQKYQRANGLKVTGILDALTRAKINAELNAVKIPAPVTPPVTPKKVLKFTKLLVVGNRSAEVTALQDYLIGQKLLTIPKDVAKGYFAQATKKALQAWQKKVGLPVTGKVDQKTLDYLNSH